MALDLRNFHFFFTQVFISTMAISMDIGFGDGWFGQGVFWFNGSLALWTFPHCRLSDPVTYCLSGLHQLLIIMCCGIWGSHQKSGLPYPPDGYLRLSRHQCACLASAREVVTYFFVLFYS